MNNFDSNIYFQTGICEKTISYRTYINLYKGLKELISTPIYIISADKVHTRYFKDVDTLNGCIILTGFNPPGFSLLNIYQKIDEQNDLVERVIVILEYIKLLVSASKIYYNNFGFFPSLLLNGVYLDEDTSTLCFISPGIVDLINSTKEDNFKKLLEYCIKPEYKEKIPSSADFSISICRLIYLFILKNNYSIFEPEVDIRCFYSFIPHDLSNIVWKGLKKKKITFEMVNEAINNAINVLKSIKENKKSIVVSKPPLFRTPFFSRIKYKFNSFISFRRGLLIVIILLGGFGAYMVIDYIRSQKERIDITGLPPKKIIEVYVNAIDNLDVEVLDTLFYRRAGKGLINEISTMYVVSRLGQIYEKFPEPDKTEEVQLPQRWDPISLKNINIEKIRNSSKPVFKVSYIKEIMIEGELKKYSEIDTLYLAKIKDKWRIVRIDRSQKEINR